MMGERVNEGCSIFSQLISFLPDREFRRCLARYNGDASGPGSPVGTSIGAQLTSRCETDKSKFNLLPRSANTVP